jgi:pilus assembly protein CpaE
LRRSLSKHSSGVSLLPHPVQMEDVALIREEHLQRVIGLLRASFTHLILDLSKGFSPTDLTALRMADKVLLIAQLELCSLRNAVRQMLTMSNDEALASKVEVVLNCVSSDADITVRKAEETIGKPIYWQVPNDPKPLVEARNQGIPLVQSAPKSKAQVSIAGLAQMLTGKPAPSQAAKASSRWSLFSRR